MKGQTKPIRNAAKVGIINRGAHFLIGHCTRLTLSVFLDFAKANKLAFLTLEVRASNYDAIALYGSRGFRSVGRRKNYYEHPKEDAIIMTLEFDHGTENSETEDTES